MTFSEELVRVVDQVLLPQLRAVKVTLAYLETELDGRSYAFDEKAKDGVDSLIDQFEAGGWVRGEIEQA